MSDGYTGGCSCKSVRYRLSSPPMFVHCCHCRDCQTHTGSAFVVNALIETDRIERLSGELELTAVQAGNGGPHDIYRCAECRTAVWSDYGRRPGMRFVRVGTLDDPAALPPDVHIYTRSKLPWVVLPDGVPSYDEFYALESVWPIESLARRALAVGDKSATRTDGT